MAFKKFKKIKIDTGNEKVDRVIKEIQDNIEETISSIVKNTRLDSQIIPNIALVSGQTNKVSHQLGRRLAGYNLRLRGQSIVWDEQATNLSPHLYLYLKCSADVTADIEVY